MPRGVRRSTKSGCQDFHVWELFFQASISPALGAETLGIEGRSQVLSIRTIHSRIAVDIVCAATMAVSGNILGLLEKLNPINDLCGFLAASCVPFVQHLPKNGRNRTLSRRSLVVCSQLLGNGHRSDGGGHPEVVPFGSFA
jgi:hypothetical protein